MFQGTQKSMFYFRGDCCCCELTVKNVWKSIFSIFWSILSMTTWVSKIPVHWLSFRSQQDRNFSFSKKIRSLDPTFGNPCGTHTKKKKKKVNAPQPRLGVMFKVVQSSARLQRPTNRGEKRHFRLLMAQYTHSKPNLLSLLGLSDSNNIFFSVSRPT